MSARVVRYSELWEAFFMRAPYGVAVLAPLRDEDDVIVDFEVLSVNSLALEMMGRSEAQVLRSRLRGLQPLFGSAGLLDRLVRALESGRGTELEHSVPAPAGGRDPATWYSVTAVPAEDRLIITISSITRRKRVLFEAVRMMSRDDLTGVGNRRLLKNHFWAKRRQEIDVSILYFDLNGFKQVNDGHGHEAGDEVLRIVAQRLEKNVRPGEQVARMGGDEFAVMVDSGDARQAHAIAVRLQEAIRQPIKLGEAIVAVDSAVGVAVFPVDGTGFHDLLRTADSRMYEDKHQAIA